MSLNQSAISQESSPTYPRATWAGQLVMDGVDDYAVGWSAAYGGFTMFIPTINLHPQILFPVSTAMFRLPPSNANPDEVNALFFVNANQGKSKQNIPPELVITQIELSALKAYEVRQIRITYPAPSANHMGYPVIGFINLLKRSKEDVLDITESLMIDFDMHSAGLPDGYDLQSQKRGILALAYASRDDLAQMLLDSTLNPTDFYNLLEGKIGLTQWRRLLSTSTLNLESVDIQITKGADATHTALMGLSELLKNRQIMHQGVPRAFFQPTIDSNTKK